MKINCCLCFRRTDQNKERKSIGTPSVFSMIEIHASKAGLCMSTFSKDKYICMKCYSKVSHYRMTDRGSNKKPKIMEPVVVEPTINKRNLRSATVLEINVEDSDDGTDDDTVVSMVEANDSFIMQTNALSINSGTTESSISLVESIGTFVDEINETINEENIVIFDDNDPQNSELMSTEFSSVESNGTEELMGNSSYSLQDDNAVDSERQNASSSTLNMFHIHGVGNTQSRCFICRSTNGRSAVPWPAIQQAWFEKKCYIPKSNRICKDHLNAANKFTDEALDLIDPSEQSVNVGNDEFGQWLREVSDLPKSNPYNFEHDGIEAEKYPMFFGISKAHFDDLLQYLHGMRNTGSRTVRSALAMFLLVLRNNMKQELIAHNFSTTQQVVSKTIDSVSALLDEHFVPKYLGYNHITREQALEQHSIKLTSNVLKQHESRLCIIADGTYNYIEKPSDFVLQRKTFSAHKKRNLLKPLYIVFPDGYILEAAGPYFCDSKNNDAANIKHHYKHSDILLFLEEDDFFLLDRGYRDIVDETTANGQSVFMPSLLNGKRTHFNCDEANESRKVRFLRYRISLLP